MTLVQRLRLFAWRRGRHMLAVSGGVFGVALFGIWLLPYTYVYETSLGASSAGGYRGPIKTLIAQVTSRDVLGDIAGESGLDGPRGLGGLLAGMDPDPVARLRVRVVPEGDVGAYERVTVEAQGRFELGAKTATQLVAARLSALDRQMRRMTQSQRERGALPSEPAGKPALLELEELRQRYPELRDTELNVRFQRAEPKLQEDGTAIAALRIRYEGHSGEAKRLEEQVRAEAAQAYAADRAERARALAAAAARESERRRSDESERRAVSRSTAEAHTGSGPHLESLESRLLKLLAVYQPRHPEVRKLQRLIKLARERAPAPAPAPASPERDADPDAEDAETRPVDYTPGVMFIADDEMPAAPAPEAMPSFWLQRAPSYMTWVAAKGRAEETRVELESLESVHEERLARHAKLAKRLERLSAARLEEQRLLGLVKEEERALEGVERTSYDPLLLGSEATLASVESPWKILPYGLLLALLAGAVTGWVGALQDRSFHAAKEVCERSGLPVLGVIPHLRGR